MLKNVLHPGQILNQLFLEPRKISINELSKQIDVKQSRLSRVIKGKQSITSELSLKLADLFQTQPEFWMTLQANYDQRKHSRGTDNPFYKLMKISGNAILKLIGVQSYDAYETRAIVLKEKRLKPDIVVYPKDANHEIVMIEFQGYKEPMMRYLMASKMSLMCAQENYTGPILGAIVYTDKQYKDAALPFSIQSESGQSYIQGEFIEIVLSTYTEEQLIDIDEKLVILAPFTLPKNYPKDEYVLKYRQWRRKIDALFSEKTVHEINNILSLFIMDRQRNMTIKEINAMYNFNIAETPIGRELIKEGRIEAEKESEKKVATKLIARQMAKKFDINLRRIMPRLKPLRTDDLMELGEHILSMASFEDAFQWINHRKKMIKMAAV